MSIEGLGANKSKKAIQRVAMAMGVLSKTTRSFDEVGVILHSGKHSEQSQLKDLAEIVQMFLECDPFNKMVKWNLYSFPHMKRNLIKTLNEDQLKHWMMNSFLHCTNPICHHQIQRIAVMTQINLMLSIKIYIYIYIYNQSVKNMNEQSLLAHCPHSQDLPQTSQHMQPACDDNSQLVKSLYKIHRLHNNWSFMQ